MLPDLDEITVAIPGLHNGQGSTVVHTHADGPVCRYALRCEVIPPLSRGTARIEVLATEPSAQARATLSLHWQ